MDGSGNPNETLTFRRGDFVMQHEGCFGDVSILRVKRGGSDYKTTTWVGEGSSGNFDGKGFRNLTFPHLTEHYRIWTEEQVRLFQRKRQAMFEEMGCHLVDGWERDRRIEAFKTKARELALGM